MVRASVWMQSVGMARCARSASTQDRAAQPLIACTSRGLAGYVLKRRVRLSYFADRPGRGRRYANIRPASKPVKNVEVAEVRQCSFGNHYWSTGEKWRRSQVVQRARRSVSCAKTTKAASFSANRGGLRRRSLKNV